MEYLPYLSIDVKKSAIYYSNELDYKHIKGPMRMSIDMGIFTFPQLSEHGNMDYSSLLEPDGIRSRV